MCYTHRVHAWYTCTYHGIIYLRGMYCASSLFCRVASCQTVQKSFQVIEVSLQLQFPLAFDCKALACSVAPVTVCAFVLFFGTWFFGLSPFVNTLLFFRFSVRTVRVRFVAWSRQNARAGKKKLLLCVYPPRVCHDTNLHNPTADCRHCKTHRTTDRPRTHQRTQQQKTKKQKTREALGRVQSR